MQFFPDVAWERDILSLRVKCKKSEAGCDWIGQLRHYEVINVFCLKVGCFKDAIIFFVSTILN